MNDTPHPLIEWIARRIRKNLNAIIMINGATGSGKTFAGLDMALRLAKRLGVQFTIKSNVDFKFSGLLKKTDFKENDKPGVIFLFEEVGAVGGGASAREWQSKANAFFHSFMQTARHKNQIFIMTCPQFAFLEKGSRLLCHVQITMQQINQRKRQSTGKPFIIQTNPITAKQYFKYLRYKIKGDNTMSKLGFMVFNLPPKEIVDEYETLKTKYTDELKKNILDADKPKEKKAGKKIPFDIWEDNRLEEKGVSQQERANIFKISLSTLKNKRNLAMN